MSEVICPVCNKPIIHETVNHPIVGIPIVTNVYLDRKGNEYHLACKVVPTSNDNLDFDDVKFYCNVCDVEIDDGDEYFDDAGNCYCGICYPGCDDDDDDSAERWDFAEAVSLF